MKKLNHFRSFVFILSFWMIVSPFLACSKKRELPAVPTAIDPAKAALLNTAGIVTSRELLAVIGNALNIDFTSNSAEVAGLLTDYRNFSGSLPQYGDHGSGFNGIMSRLITNFVAKACTISVRNEAGTVALLNNRVVFKFIDVSKPITDPINMNADRWRAFVKHIAYRFWGTVPSEDEVTLIYDFANRMKPLASGTGPALTQDVAVLICSLTGSAPRAVFKNAE